MGGVVYRDALGAWQGLSKVGGLELDGRDEDLGMQLKNLLDPDAESLEAALAATSTAVFLQALFQVIQPFASMFQDVLGFFEKAGARQGQTQWKVSVGEEVVELRHFEEFLEHWTSIECEIEIPLIDIDSAFLHNVVRLPSSSGDHLHRSQTSGGSTSTGIDDADDWLAEYDQGRYAPLPESLQPDKLGPGLDDVARIVIAALSIIRRRGMDREELLAEHRAGAYGSVKLDALHPWAIALNETDYWLGSMVQCLATFLKQPVEEREEYGARLASAYAAFPRRRMSADVDVKDLERLLSLPAWKKRHELYGVWVATEIVRALKDHEITINHADGELKFAFVEARIADVESAWPRVSLFSERRTALADPIGKGRKSSVQPDFGIWARRPRTPEDCGLIVEVKHYKRRSKRNFREALIDYANAHPSAKVVLVNYGPVGPAFADLPVLVRDRCTLIGYLNPENRAAQEEFRDVIRNCVGEPAFKNLRKDAAVPGEILAVDSSASMIGIHCSSWFRDFIGGREDRATKVAVVDRRIRAFETCESLKDWFDDNQLGFGTELSGPVTELLRDHDHVVVVTDQDGLDSLSGFDATIRELEGDNPPNVKLLEISKPGRH